MRKILFFAYFFPPLGGGGTPRSVKFVKYLHRFGYLPTVVTGEPAAQHYSREFQVDDSGAGDLEQADYDLLRFAHPRQNSFWRWFQRSRLHRYAWAAAYPVFYDRQRSWAFRAAREVVRKARKRRFDLIYVSAAPCSALEAAAWASKQLDIPWVADLRDLWTRDTLKFYPSRWHYHWESKLEHRVLRSAAAIVANTPLSGERLREWLPSDVRDRVIVIPNGFDADETAPTSAGKPGRGLPVTIVHTGTLYDPGIRRSRVGRFFPLPIEDTARSLEPVAKGLLALRAEHPELAARIRIRLLGYTPDRSRELVREMGLSEQVVCEGTVPRDEAVAAVRDADALLIVQVAWAEAERPMSYVPGKIYDYLASSAPILAPVGPGDLRNLLERAPQAYLCDYRDPRSVAAQLGRLVNDLDQDRVGRCDPEWLSQFDRLHLTERLAQVFDGVLLQPGRRQLELAGANP